MATTGQMVKALTKAMTIHEWAFGREGYQRPTLGFHLDQNYWRHDGLREQFTLRFPLAECFKVDGEYPQDEDGYGIYAAYFKASKFSEVLSFLEWLEQIEKVVPLKYLSK